MLNKLTAGLFIGIFCGIFYQTGYTLDSDSEQPATLDADDFEIDFNTGIRIYRGNVAFRQGSIRLTCDELTTYRNDDDELDKAVCTGNPGRFKQRPADAEEDMVGTAMEITMDEVENLVTLKDQAKVVQGDSTVSGPVITYNRLTRKAFVKGGGSTTTTGRTDAENARPSMTIQPRKNTASE